MIITDASFLVIALADDDGEGPRARARLGGEELAAPHLIDVEVTSVLRRAVLAGNVTEQRAQQALRDLADLNIERIATPHCCLASGNYAATTPRTTPAASPLPSCSARRC